MKYNADHENRPQRLSQPSKEGKSFTTLRRLGSTTFFTVLTGIVIIFQGCLAAGVPWGEASMGGRYPGKYPPKMRVIAVINMFILGFIAAIVLSEADLKISQLKPIAVIGVWFVVAFFVVGTIMNRLRSESATHYKD